MTRVQAALAATLLGFGFAWGFLAHRNDLPPAGALRAVARAVRPEPALKPVKAWRKAPALNPTGAQLEALGYTGGDRPSTMSGVTRHDPARAHPGERLWTSGHAPLATLMRPDGSVVRTWQTSLRAALPDAHPTGEYQTHFRRARRVGSDGLVVIFEWLGLALLDGDSRVVWSVPEPIHHDVVLRDDGGFLALSRRIHVIPSMHPTETVSEDEVLWISPSGAVERRLSILEAIADSRFHALLRGRPPHGDLLHANALSALDGRHADRNPAFQKGNLLVSLRNVDALVVIDPGTERVVWALRGPFAEQHDPHLLDDGGLLLFNNVAAPERSEALELDPLTQAVRWRWPNSNAEDGPGGDAAGSPAEVPAPPLFSRYRGTVQRLSNGNTLITESDGGRVIEVTADGAVVWEFFNPHRVGEDGAFVAAIQGMFIEE